MIATNTVAGEAAKNMTPLKLAPSFCYFFGNCMNIFCECYKIYEED